MYSPPQKKIDAAARAVREAEVMVITAGAGMGVDSGLPDFRGDEGFWKAYPMYEKLGVNFVNAATPQHFINDPEFGWGFYGHRLNLYRETTPHEGFSILQKWIKQFQQSHFVITSNVDGHFQKAGFSGDFIEEIHGSIHHLQCARPCRDAIWEHPEPIPVDLETMRALEVPRCPHCGGVARPNILMFGDGGWVDDRTRAQTKRLNRFFRGIRREKVVVLELGAGVFIPSIRRMTDQFSYDYNADVFRINPVDYHIQMPHTGIPAGALQALRLIDEAI